MLHAGTDVCKAAIQAAAMDAAGSIVLEADIKADKSSANRLLSKTPKCPKLVTESPPAYRRLHDHMADESKSGSRREPGWQCPKNSAFSSGCLWTLF